MRWRRIHDETRRRETWDVLSFHLFLFLIFLKCHLDRSLFKLWKRTGEGNVRSQVNKANTTPFRLYACRIDESITGWGQRFWTDTHHQVSMYMSRDEPGRYVII